MLATQRNRTALAATVMAVMGLLEVAGCSGGPRTYPVRGKVELAAGDIQVLAGSNVEAALESDPTVRASGVIEPDGSFTLETLHAGAILKGAQEGNYQARIVLSDDDKEIRRQAARALAPRFLQFQTSGLSFQVPTQSGVTLIVAPR
jgi:hypothetical protein